MRPILPILIAAAMLPALPLSAMAATQVANSGASQFCGADAAEGYKRPGGFCDQLDDMNSLAPTSDDDGCKKVSDAGYRFDGQSGRLLVAEPMYDPCCPHYGMLTPGQVLPAEGLLVAAKC